MKSYFLVFGLFVSTFAAGAFASIIGEDDREELPANQEKVGFSEREVKRAFACMGYIWCPSANDGKGGSATAGALCAPGPEYVEQSNGCAADRIATARHLFFTRYKPIPNRETCFFKNYLGQKISINVSDLDGQDHPFEPRDDYAVVRLREPIESCDPFPIYEQNSPLRVDQPVVALTHRQARMGSRFKGQRPLAYPCKVTRVFASRDEYLGGGKESSSPSVFYTDCDNAEGGSGGFVLVRDGANHELHVRGILSGGGTRDMDFKPYSEALGNQTAAIGADNNFVLHAKDPSRNLKR